MDMFSTFVDPQHSFTDQVLRAYEHRDKWTKRMILGDWYRPASPTRPSPECVVSQPYAHFFPRASSPARFRSSWVITA
jgi:hypothetical protein